MVIQVFFHENGLAFAHPKENMSELSYARALLITINSVATFNFGSNTVIKVFLVLLIVSKPLMEI